MDDAYLGGEHHEAKRGRGALGKTPFVTAVQTTEEEVPSERKVAYLMVSALADFKSRTILGWAQRRMEQGWKCSSRPMFKWRFNRRFDLTTLFDRLLHASVLTPPMSQRLLVLAETCR